jgi:hypothetical protein
MLTEISDARLVARQAAWASHHARPPPVCPYNTGNGDVFRYKRIWKTIADHFGVDGRALCRPNSSSLQATDGRCRAGLARHGGEIRTWPSRISRASPPGGTPTPTSAARSNASPT